MGEALYRIRLNTKRCIGCGLCEENLPDVFAMGDFTARLREDLIVAACSQDLVAVARDCPVNAITVVPESGYTAYHHDQKRQDEEYGGEIREYKRKHGH